MGFRAYDEIYEHIVRLCPPSKVLQVVADLPPVSLDAGEQRLRASLADRDWLTAMALAKRLAQTDGWEQRVEAQGLHPSGICRAVAAAMDTTYWFDDAAATKALDDAIAATSSRAERFPLVREGLKRDFRAGFVAYLYAGLVPMRPDGAVADGLVHGLLPVLTANAYLNSADLRAFVNDMAEAVFSVFRPEHLVPQAGDTDA